MPPLTPLIQKHGLAKGWVLMYSQHQFQWCKCEKCYFNADLLDTTESRVFSLATANYISFAWHLSTFFFFTIFLNLVLSLFLFSTRKVGSINSFSCRLLCRLCLGVGSYGCFDIYCAIAGPNICFKTHDNISKPTVHG